MIGVKRIETAGIHEGCKVGIFYLFDLTTAGAYQMGVGKCDAFILGLHALKNVASQHLSLNEQFHGVVNCRTTHAETIFINQQLQLLDSKVPIDVHDAVQDGITLCGFAHSMLIQIVTELAHNGVVAVDEVFYVLDGFHLM